MARTGRTFSESWHRVANLKVSLRPTVRVHRQFFRGERWYVLHDPFNNQFFRLRPEAHDFVIRLGPDRTVEQVWEDCLNRHPDEAPGQEDVIQLLTQLYYANLLYFEMPPDSAKLFERYKKRRQREIQSRLLSIMFARFPLLDPEIFLKRIMPLIKLLVSPFGAIVWLAVVIAAVKVVVDHFDAAFDQFQGVLAPENLFLLYTGLVVIKTLHEFGHALVCKRYGGEVHTMGVMLLVFTPLPYMDATSSWSFKSRWHRALVGAAGMITELFVAALAVFLWAYTSPGTLHSLAYNMMAVASISTVIFNGNPLLRFDGYYILSDLLDIPNLYPRSMRYLRHLVERYVFGYKESVSPAQGFKEAFWMCTYGILSGIYRFVVFSGVILFVADKWLLAGLLMALVCVISWGIVPLFRLINYLSSSPRLTRTRTRAVAIIAGAFAVVVLLLAVIPFPNRFRAPGVMEAVQYVKVVNDAPGYVEKVLAPPGAEVRAGAALVTLANRELELETEAALAQREEAMAMVRKARQMEKADLEPLLKRLETVETKLKDLLVQKESLTVKARESGRWVAPKITELRGSWLPRGTTIGEIVNHGAFRFSAVVSQEEASELFAGHIEKAEVRLYGQSGNNLNVKDYQIIPFQHEKLPSAALGWLGGGEVRISTKDQSGRQAAEPFFQIYAHVIPAAEVVLFHGRSGKLRFTLDSKPLVFQWGRKFLQLLQKRYQI
jgi:putative peptide zinc metalloprotease protein